MALDVGGDTALSVSAEQAVGPYLRAVRRHWRLVAAVSLLAVVIAGVTIYRIGSTYTTTASILVTPLPEGDAGFVGIGTVVDTGDPGQSVQTAAALIDNHPGAQAAAKQLGRPWTESSVFEAVTVAPEGASNVVDITATASTATEAQRVANAFTTDALAYRAAIVQGEIARSIAALQAELDQVHTSASSPAETQTLATSISQLKSAKGTGGEPTLSLAQSAPLPTGPNGASKELILFLALVGGFALGSVAAVGLETFSRPVRDREEIAAIYPLPVLAALPLVAGRRRTHGTPPWALPADVFEQLRMLRVQLSLAPEGRVIMVTSAGAGDGKTTVAAALAAAFAEADQSVILLDLDLRKPDLRRLLGVDEAVEPEGLSPRAPAGVPVSVPKLPGVRVFPTPRGDMSTVETLVQRLPLLIAQARRAADFVVVDSAPVGEVSEALRIAAICDQVVFVARPRHTDRRRLTLARDLLERAGRSPVGMVLVGKETGMPRGDHGYAYSMSPMSALVSNGAHRSGKRSPAAAPLPADDEPALERE
jgi:Mrp family chromosome partitioning ATPase/capsular polysaccharide biosynthesis protein